MIENVDLAANEPTATNGIINTLKENIDTQAIAQKLKISQDQLFDIGLFAGIGFLLGFFIKRYATYVIAFGIFVTGLIVLSQFNMLSFHINWGEVYKILHIPAGTAVGVNNIATIVWEWARSNVIAASSFTISLLIGLKIG